MGNVHLPCNFSTNLQKSILEKVHLYEDTTRLCMDTWLYNLTISKEEREKHKKFEHHTIKGDDILEDLTEGNVWTPVNLHSGHIGRVQYNHCLAL